MDLSSVDFSSVAALRSSLRIAKLAGEVSWIRLDGLSLRDRAKHSALCHALARFGFGAERTPGMPTLAVLDWSGVGECTADGLALFAVLVRYLRENCVDVVACRPADVAIAEVLERSGIVHACGGMPWVTSPAASRSDIRSVAPATVFSPETSDSLAVFCDELSASLKSLGVSRSTVGILMGATQEFLHNVLSHAEARHAAAAAVLLPRKRPKVLQIGIADDGIGIAGAMLRHARYEWLDWFHDVSVTATVLDRALSGRPHPLDTGRGGGMARIVQRLLHQTTSSVLLRSGAGLISLECTTPDRFRRTALTYGAGTQVRIEIRLG